MKYRNKPVVIEAFQLGKDEFPEWAWERRNVDMTIIFGDKPELLINTLEGIMTAHVGDYVIKGIKGELYPCRADIFEETYEPVTEEAT